MIDSSDDNADYNSYHRVSVNGLVRMVFIVAELHGKQNKTCVNADLIIFF